MDKEYQITCIDWLSELAQKLYEDDGYSGNIYKKAPVERLRYYENKAVDLLDNTRKYKL